MSESKIMDVLDDSEEVSKVVKGMLSQGSLFEAHFVNQGKNGNGIGDRVFTIRPNECFQLLEHYELKEARRASRAATGWAIAALVVSFIGSMASLLSSFS